MPIEPNQPNNGESVAPLRDPLRTIRALFGWLLVVQFVWFAVQGVALYREFRLATRSARDIEIEAVGLSQEEADLRRQDRMSDLPIGLAILAVMTSLKMIPTFLIWQMLPKRPVDAIYLRSFRNDVESWPIRKALAQTLGDDFRLSGIRAPKTRWPYAVRPMLMLPYIFRYLSPKHLNLEADDDWFARLWRTLDDVRCAFIDVRDLTPHVAQEVRMVTGTLTTQRVLFLIDDSITCEEWKRRIWKCLKTKNVELDQLKVALIVESDMSRLESFKRQIRGFTESLPDQPVELKRRTFRLVKNSLIPDREHLKRDSSFWFQTIVGLVAINVLIFVFIHPSAESSDAADRSRIRPTTRSIVLTLLPLAVTFVFGVAHLRESGSRRNKMLTRLYLGFIVLVVIPLFLVITPTASAYVLRVYNTISAIVANAPPEEFLSRDDLKRHHVFSVEVNEAENPSIQIIHILDVRVPDYNSLKHRYTPLEEIEELQNQQLELLQYLHYSKGIEEVFLEGMTDENAREYEKLARDLRQSPSNTTFLHRAKRIRSVLLGAAARLNEIRQLPAEDSGLWKAFQEGRDVTERREDAIAERLLAQNKPVVVLILDGVHDLNDNLPDTVEYVRLTLTAYRKIVDN